MCGSDQNNDNGMLQIISNMRNQENERYKTCDYLNRSHELDTPANVIGHLSSQHYEIVQDFDVDCRTKIVAWCFKVAQCCKVSRETVAVTMNILDRYMATACSRAKVDRETYQLAAMTSLYTAIKIHEVFALDPKFISALSYGAFTPNKVEEMELELLTALNWRMNPPTAVAFVRCFLILIPDSTLEKHYREIAYDLSKFQTEFAVSEYKFINFNPSKIGYCALMNALELIGIDETTLLSVSSVLEAAINMGVDEQQEISKIQMWLYQAIVHGVGSRQIFAHHHYSIPSTKTALTALPRRSSCELSPRTIAY